MLCFYIDELMDIYEILLYNNIEFMCRTLHKCYRILVISQWECNIVPHRFRILEMKLLRVHVRVRVFRNKLHSVVGIRFDHGI